MLPTTIPLDPFRDEHDAAVHANVAIDLPPDLCQPAAGQHTVELPRLTHETSVEHRHITVRLATEVKVCVTANRDVPVHLATYGEILCHVDVVVEFSAVRPHGRSVRVASRTCREATSGRAHP